MTPTDNDGVFDSDERGGERRGGLSGVVTSVVVRKKTIQCHNGPLQLSAGNMSGTQVSHACLSCLRDSEQSKTFTFHKRIQM